MMTAFALAGFTFAGAYGFLRLVAWRENQTTARLDRSYKSAREAIPKHKTTLTLNNHRIEI